MSKKKPSIFGAIKNLIFVVPSLFRILSNTITLMRYEARLAGKNLILLLICSIFFAGLLFSTWLCILGLIFIALSFYLPPLAALAGVLLINVLLVLVILFMMYKIKNKINFSATSEQIAKIKRLHLLE